MCIINKTIPKDTPHYFKKALERAMKEYEKGIILEKSALANFAEKFIIEGIPGLIPLKYFEEKAPQIKDFLRNHRNTKVRMILVCEMERQIIQKTNEESICWMHNGQFSPVLVCFAHWSTNFEVKETSRSIAP